ncbi:hypothetical protein FYM52_02025 [Comamonas sp. CAH-2]|nr:hypothetical protein [Comamonas sp. CAH-2]
MSYVQSTRLSVCRWLAAAALGFLALNAHAIDQIYNWNGLEFVRSGNAHHVHPASPESTRLRGGWVLDISDVEPKVTGKHDLPYQHKGGALAKVSVIKPINKQSLAISASDLMKSAAAAVSVAASNPYVQLGAHACLIFCAPLAEWGYNQIKKNTDGSLSVEATDPNTLVSVADGYSYCTTSGCGTSIHGACFAFLAAQSQIIFRPPGSASVVSCTSSSVVIAGTAYNGSYQQRDSYLSRSGSSSCTAGSTVVNGVCNGVAPKVDTPLQRIFEDNIVNKPWGPVQVSVVKALIENGHNVFTDGTDTTITGPDSVPLGTTKTSWPVNVLPGTTTPAPAGHTGATDSGTQTTTTTTTAKNTFSPSGSSSGGSGSSGGPASLGSMTTTQQTTTTTTITNNITNNTSTSVTNNVTETDEAPKEEEKDFCEKNPDALACAELDTPEQDVPRREINISYEYANIFGNGACPSDAYLNTHGQSLKVWDWQATCSNVQDYVKPVLIACCAFGAYLIIVGVKE